MSIMVKKEYKLEKWEKLCGITKTIRDIIKAFKTLSLPFSASPVEQLITYTMLIVSLYPYHYPGLESNNS